jgi:ATP/ADP translocase
MYVFADLWSVVMIHLMFWQFANHIFNTEQARRFYPLLGMLGNVGLVLAGNILVFFADVGSSQDLMKPAYLQSQDMLQGVILSITVSGCIAICLFIFINKRILNHKVIESKFSRLHEDTKTKLSALDSIRLVLQSKYISHIVLLVLCYGLLINILEGPWKAKVKEYYPTTIEYVNFMGRFNIYMGITCIGFTFIASNVLRRLSWLTAALFTPSVIFCTGILFLVFMVFPHKISFLGVTIDPVFAAVVIGALQNILSKATKYSLFDATKEMAYIPLPLELRTKGKATAEVIGLKFGKSIGAFVQSGVFMILPSASFNSMPVYLLLVFLVFIIIWFRNVIALNKEYLLLSDDKHR